MLKGQELKNQERECRQQALVEVEGPGIEELGIEEPGKGKANSRL